MSKDNVLKKQFSEKDVQRLRNLVKGKYGDKTTIGIGYTKKEESYSEGDVWEENGRKWTIKDGIKQNITKLDKAKLLNHLPLFCPECNSLMKNRNDKVFYNTYKRCFECHVKFETELRRLGLWEEYEKNIINNDITNIIDEFTAWADDELNSNNESYITEDGEIENWIGNTKNKILQNKEETIKYLLSLKRK